jgi:hypothetical protein
MVECLLRYATVHDVEKCWKQLVDKDEDKYESCSSKQGGFYIYLYFMV